MALARRGCQRSPHRDSRQHEVCKRLAYKINAYIGEDVIYATPERAVFYLRVEHALWDSKTWAEFRRAMPRKEYSRLLRERFDENDKPRPRGSDAFDVSQFPGAEESDYPQWLMQERLHGALPEDVVEKYGKAGCSFVSGPCLIIGSSDFDEVNAELEKRGYELIDGSDPYME